MKPTAGQLLFSLAAGALVAALVITLIVGLSGCSSWNGIDVKVRPGGHKDTAPVQPAPAPPKEPDPYDWEPWWNRPRPRRDLKLSLASTSANDVGQHEEASQDVRPHWPHNTTPHPGPVIEVVSTFWKYFRFPLTIFEAVQQILMLTITLIFIYGMSWLALLFYRTAKGSK